MTNERARARALCMNEYDRNIVSLLSKLFTFLLPLEDPFPGGGGGSRRREGERDDFQKAAMMDEEAKNEGRRTRKRRREPSLFFQADVDTPAGQEATVGLAPSFPDMMNLHIFLLLWPAPDPSCQLLGEDF